MNNGSLCPDGGHPVGIDAYGNNICPSYGGRNSIKRRGGKIRRRRRRR